MAYLSSSDAWSLALCAALCLGCPGDDGSGEGDSGSADATETTPSTSASTSGNGTTTDVATSAASSDSATDTTEGPGDSTGAGVPCGESTCTNEEYCEWNANSCGELEFDEGTCMPRPEGCTAEYDPVCGCDGQVHGNACDARAQGVDVDADGECEAPKEYFRCGYRFCDLGLEYCRLGVSDVGGEPDSYECIQPTMPCNPVDCMCLQTEPCFEFSCDATEDGGVMIVCPGG